jgi:hypothetical protein
MNIFMPVKKDEEILDGVFDFGGRMVYSSLIYAIQGFTDGEDAYIMEAQLLDEKEIKECICQSLIGNRFSKLRVKWVAIYTKKLMAA